MEPVMHIRRALSFKNVLLIICLRVFMHTDERERGSDEDLGQNVRIERSRRESRYCNET
jgi:hypothetical protein